MNVFRDYSWTQQESNAIVIVCLSGNATWHQLKGAAHHHSHFWIFNKLFDFHRDGNMDARLIPSFPAREIFMELEIISMGSVIAGLSVPPVPQDPETYADRALREISHSLNLLDGVADTQAFLSGENMSVETSFSAAKERTPSDGYNWLTCILLAYFGFLVKKRARRVELSSEQGAYSYPHQYYQTWAGAKQVGDAVDEGLDKFWRDHGFALPAKPQK